MEKYVADHMHRYEFMLKDLARLVKPGYNICNIGLSDFDSLAVRKYGINYYCAVPNQKYLDDFPAVISVEKQNILFYDLSAPEQSMDKKFDIVVFAETLEHMFAEDEIIINSISNLLVPKGILYLTVPNSAKHINRLRLLFGRNIYWSKKNVLRGVYGGYGHIREYTVREITDLLEPVFILRELYGIDPYGNKLQRALLNLFPRNWRSIIIAVATKA